MPEPEKCGSCGSVAGPKNVFCRKCGFAIGDRLQTVRLSTGLGRHTMNRNVQEFFETGDPSKV